MSTNVGSKLPVLIGLAIVVWRLKWCWPFAGAYRMHLIADVVWRDDNAIDVGEHKELTIMLESSTPGFINPLLTSMR
ncbi:hypothetical protein [Brevibacterium aurantiacum]|uniref:hypothetical protein n=1 Tax=Brevibacterium aurantiacum TaxID=273384 RepID=UPI000F650501|nr:hypothetical protein [Brevibacterium aurantiacum]